MRTQIATTFEQSRKLFESKLPGNTANCFANSDGTIIYDSDFYHPTPRPAWTLSALWGIVYQIYRKNRKVFALDTSMTPEKVFTILVNTIVKEFKS